MFESETIFTASDISSSSDDTTTYTVTIANDIANGTVTADKTSAAKGAEVTLTATPNEGYELDTLTVKDANDAAVTVENNKFTMPESNVTVTATFKATSSSSSVNAEWDFTKQPAGFPTSDAEADAVTDLAIPVTSGEGATLTATGRFKWATDHIQAQASSGKTVADAATWKETSGGKWLTLTLTKAAAKVTLVYSGAGALDAKRFVAIYAADDSEIFSTAAEGIDKTQKTKEFASVPAGTYTIAMNGSSIYSLKCE